MIAIMSGYREDLNFKYGYRSNLLELLTMAIGNLDTKYYCKF